MTDRAWKGLAPRPFPWLDLMPTADGRRVGETGGRQSPRKEGFDLSVGEGHTESRKFWSGDNNIYTDESYLSLCITRCRPIAHGDAHVSRPN